jgi:hypothetical protein
MRDYAALAARIQAACPPPLSLSVYGEQTSLDGAERYELYLVQVPSQLRFPRFRMLLNGGTHGDEPAGAEAVVTFLEKRLYRHWPEVGFTITPCTNPWGYVHDTREGPGGRDLNRAFQRATRVTPQISLYKRALRGRRFDLFVDCHEDVDSPGLYVFARGENLGRAIVDAVRAAGGPIHPGPLVDGEIPLVDGVVTFPRRRRRPRLVGSTRHLSGYVSRYYKTFASATVETPTRLPLRRRVKMHLTAIEAALATLTEK